MPGEGDEKLRSVLSHSGFPLQMRVRREIEEHASEHEFTVVASDFPWMHREETGFVDLVLTKRVWVLVLDCKRAGREESQPWVFLVSEKDVAEVSRATCLWTGPWKQGGGRSRQDGHDDMDFEPVSYEAEFCAIMGSPDRRENLIERIASTLVKAAKSIYSQQASSKRAQDVNFRAVYVPVIVTTADLHVARVDDVSLDDGRMRGGKFDRVDVVRLRKSLDQPWGSIEDLRDAYEQSQRTVFVVRARAIVEFLKDWRLLHAPQWPEMRDIRLR